ncbi:MAG: hypothetical protein WCO89_07370 [Syntrophus sp. (in: bacteria)]
MEITALTNCLTFLPVPSINAARRYQEVRKKQEKTNHQKGHGFCPWPFFMFKKGEYHEQESQAHERKYHDPLFMVLMEIIIEQFDRFLRSHAPPPYSLP